MGEELTVKDIFDRFEKAVDKISSKQIEILEELRDEVKELKTEIQNFKKLLENNIDAVGIVKKNYNLMTLFFIGSASLTICIFLGVKISELLSFVK